MKRCHKCNSRMVEVNLIDLKKRKHKALVCTYCGHIYSKDELYRKAWKLSKEA